VIPVFEMAQYFHFKEAQYMKEGANPENIVIPPNKTFVKYILDSRLRVTYSFNCCP